MSATPTRLAAAACVIFALALAPGAPPGPDDASSKYRIGVDDVLHVVVWGEEGLDLTLRVRPDGRISLPLAQDVYAKGHTPAGLAERIAGRLSEYLRAPAVSVMVEEINSFKVYVLGHVSTQGVYSFTQAPGLLELLAAAGGLTEFASEDVTVLRREGEQETRTRIDLGRVFAGRGEARNVTLEPGDVVLVH